MRLAPPSLVGPTNKSPTEVRVSPWFARPAAKSARFGESGRDRRIGYSCERVTGASRTMLSGRFTLSVNAFSDGGV